MHRRVGLVIWDQKISGLAVGVGSSWAILIDASKSVAEGGHVGHLGSKPSTCWDINPHFPLLALQAAW